MLLTLKQSAPHGLKSFHDYSPPTPPATARYSPPLSISNGPSLPSLNPVSLHHQSMSNPHRGLPPPAAMTLPQPNQPPSSLVQPPPPPPPSLGQPLGQLPGPPQQWQGAEESMRNWLLAKAEEDKRKQEEEKTRQEQIRLEQRKIEQEMLRTSLAGGVPPYLIPLVFAGMGGGNLPNASLEWAQHYMAQAHQLQHQAQQQQIPQQQPPHVMPPHTQLSSPSQRRDSQMLVQSYGAPPPPTATAIPSTPLGSGSQQTAGFVPSYQMSPASRNRPVAHFGSGPGVRGLQGSQLPRLNTGEMQVQHPPMGPSSAMHLVSGTAQASHTRQQAPTAQQPQQESSPSIYFHHWQPPTSQASSSTNQPTTPSGISR